MITEFQGPYRFLSNFWPVTVAIDGDDYPSVEHAYVAAKTLDTSDRRIIRHTLNPGKVKRFGRTLKLREDWETIKLPVMEMLLRQKFAYEDFHAKLIETTPHELIEGNTWGDTFWGVCNGKGQNHLGKLLMQIREEISNTRPVV